jgi:hypothetical protein
LIQRPSLSSRFQFGRLRCLCTVCRPVTGIRRTVWSGESIGAAYRSGLANPVASADLINGPSSRPGQAPHQRHSRQGPARTCRDRPRNAIAPG